MIVRAAPPDHLGWLGTRVGLTILPDVRGIEAIDAQGRIAAMVGYNAWTANSAQMHFAADSPIAIRSLIRPAFHYLFNQAGRNVALGLVRADNERALALDRHLGFREIARVRDGFEVGVDAVLLELRREECRWLLPAGKAGNDGR